MLNLLKSLTRALSINQYKLPVVEDPTLYYVETTLGKYSGRIMYQDDVMMMLRNEKPKTIKILKVNIRRISIVQVTG